MTEEDGWLGIKPCFPVAVDGVYPGNVEATINMLGQNIVLAVRTAIYNHPGGFEDKIRRGKIYKKLPDEAFSVNNSFFIQAGS